MHPRFVPPFAVALTAATMLSASAGDVLASDRYREFRDMSVSCTIALTCDIQARPASGEADGVGFMRAAGPDTPLAFFLFTSRPLHDGEVVVAVDGREIARLSVAAFEEEAHSGKWVASGVAARTLMAEMRNGSNASVKVASAPAQAFSLAGLVASARFVDEVQGRVGARDALETRGSGESPPARIRDVTAIADIPDRFRHDFEAPDGICSFYQETRFGYMGGFAATLDEGYSLYALPCAEGGAYNQPFAFYADNGNAAYRLSLPSMTDDGPSAEQVAWNIDWDQAGRVLTAFFKGRGVGDCGSYDRWTLRDDVDVPAFVLRESRFKDDCDGNYAGGPENWPLVWPRSGR